MKKWIIDRDSESENEISEIKDEDGNSIIQYAGCGSHMIEVSPENLNKIVAVPDMIELIESAIQNPDHWDKDRARALLRSFGVYLTSVDSPY